MAAGEEHRPGGLRQVRRQIEVRRDEHLRHTLIDHLLDNEAVALNRPPFFGIERRVGGWHAADSRQRASAHLLLPGVHLRRRYQAILVPLPLLEERLRTAVHMTLQLERHVVIAVKVGTEAERNRCSHGGVPFYAGRPV